MHFSSRAVALAAMLLIILAVHLAIAWQDVAVLSRNGFLYDDSFYAFKISQNIAAGKGLTFDGEHSTSGFQPLYVFLLVPVYLVSGHNAILPIRIALSLLALFTCLTAYVLYRIARRSVGFKTALVAAAIWGLSPVVLRQGTNGLETAVATFMIAVSFYYYVSRVRAAEAPTGRRFFALGLLLGLAVLSRIDAVLLVLVILLDYLVLLRRRGATARCLARLAFVPLGVMIFYGPWLAFTVIESGSPLQDSGTAIRYLSLAYAPYFHNGSSDLALNGPGGSFIWGQVTHSLTILKLLPPLHVVFRSLERIGAAIGFSGTLSAAANVGGLLALGGFIWMAIRWRRSPGKSHRSENEVLLLFSGLLVASYSLYVFGAFYFIRYFYPIYFVGTLYGAFLMQDLFSWYRRRAPAVRRAAVAAAAVYTVLFLLFGYSQAFRSKLLYPFYDVARWVTENTRQDETIGVFQCGTIGYFCDRRVINLDGKVNRAALTALKSGRLESYIREEGIDVVLDHAKVLEIFLGVSLETQGTRCTEVCPTTLNEPTGWVAMRLSAPLRLGSRPTRASL